MSRDNFSQNTTRILAERVGFLCSNPKCRSHTVGPNQQKDKSTKIGEAAHITAAAAGGPRYDPNLTIDQRSDIENGIWLCSNCSDLIDKDFENYPTPLLKKWKAEAEFDMYERIKGKKQDNFADMLPGPFLEADLRYNSSGRWNKGYSYKNPVEADTDGNPVMIIGFGTNPIIHWKLDWEYSLFIYNNSSYPAFNVKIEQISNQKFTKLSELPKINNLQSMGKLELTAGFEDYLEGNYIEADSILKNRIPKVLDGLTIQLIYLDEQRHEHVTLVTISGQDIVNIKK